MPNDARYTAVTVTKTAKADLEALQVALSSYLGRRLSYGETITAARDLLREHGIDLPGSATARTFGVSELPPER